MYCVSTVSSLLLMSMPLVISVAGLAKGTIATVASSTACRNTVYKAGNVDLHRQPLSYAQEECCRHGGAGQSLPPDSLSAVSLRIAIFTSLSSLERAAIEMRTYKEFAAPGTSKKTSLVTNKIALPTHLSLQWSGLSVSSEVCLHQSQTKC